MRAAYLCAQNFSLGSESSSDATVCDYEKREKLLLSTPHIYIYIYIYMGGGWSFSDKEVLGLTFYYFKKFIHSLKEKICKSWAFYAKRG